MAKATKTTASPTLKTPIDDGGYQADFLGSKFKIPFPELSDAHKQDLVKLPGGKSKIDYLHYSVVMCKSRRLAYFTAVNIDGTEWQNNPRIGVFQADPRLDATADQLGAKLYSATKSDFDKGHLVRREDPEWGTPAISKQAGKNTFWYPNCTPQHKDLNRMIWAELESNILHTGADEQNLRINLFTGPILSPNDGVFVTQVEGKDILIPNLFWKVVVWTRSDGKAYAVGFIQSQEKFLIAGGIIKKQFVANAKGLKALTDDDIFEHLVFKDGKTYQVKIDQIEKLSGLTFNWPAVTRPFKAAAPKALSGTKVPNPKKKMKELAKRKGFVGAGFGNMQLNVKIKGLTL
ncbi:MAG TPA: DNA/RNA non-specific endonuclease [Puia sp.]|nr:DNA/RNA non-specific endonuclease [Puia sp.]